MSWKPERRRKFFRIAYQVDDEVYNGYHSETEMDEEMKLDWCLNHSCDPNAWYVTKDVVEARRKIAKGEEICYDYASKTLIRVLNSLVCDSQMFGIVASQANDKMKMPCNCGTSLCRGTIFGDDWRLERLQKEYGRHFLPYILRKIDASKQSAN